MGRGGSALGIDCISDIHKGLPELSSRLYIYIYIYLCIYCYHADIRPGGHYLEAREPERKAARRHY